MRLIALAAAAATLMSLPAVAAPQTEDGPVKSVFQPIKSCASHDSGEDAYVYECKGPGGRKATLAYADGRLKVYFDDSDQSPAWNDVMNVPPVANRLFGKTLEWRVRDGKACAAVMRVWIDAGERLIVSDLAPKGGAHVLKARSNGEARARADEICGGGSAPAQDAKAAPGDDMVPIRYESADARTDKRGEKYWGKDILTQVIGAASDYGFDIAEKTIDGHRYVFTMATSSYFCGAQDCQFRIFRDGVQLPTRMACSDNASHRFGTKPLRFSSCGRPYKIQD